VSRGRVAGLAIAVAAVLYAIAPLVRGPAELPIPQHHLLHALLVAASAVAGILMCQPRARGTRSSPGWIVVAMVAPILTMMLMWPSEYSFFEQHPAGHVLEHLGLVGLAFLTGFAGERFARGVGWASGGSAFLMALLAVWGFGISPPTATQPVAVPDTGRAAPAVRAERGAIVFRQNCAACHGADGSGASGPPLKKERARKDLRATVEWIENPAPPMPKFYPDVLSAGDVEAVAAYVQTL
jgi:mono/diheme cytochrome c family protein